MRDKELMKDIYKYFGEKQEEKQEAYSIANIFYELGNEEKGEIEIEKSQDGE